MRKAINLILIITFALSSIFAVEVKGKVKYVGKPPKAKRLRMDADPVCAASHREAARAESFIVDADGNLANVIVYLEGVSYSGKAPTKPVVLDQSGCIYSPHVVGLRAGQPLKILNSDATMHNIHGLPKVNREFNFGMPKSLKEKSSYITNLSNGRIKELAIRIMGRNYLDYLSGSLLDDYNKYLDSILYQQSLNSDFRDEKRHDPNELLSETNDLIKKKTLNNHDLEILNSLKDLISLKTRRQQDLGF